jgi:hypothetical protein
MALTRVHNPANGLFFSFDFFIHFHTAHPLCFSLHNPPFEMVNNPAQNSTEIRSEKDYPEHEPYPARMMSLPF